jgi:ubiquinone/menaquinone biosynthesis C-methylase UbiE
MNVQYGCGKCAPDNWVNFDISPTLRLEKLPIIGRFFIRNKWGAYPKNVKIGNILNGLPGIKDNSCDAVYCSHVLEHLHYNDLQSALKNSHSILKPGGIFRLVVPDMEVFVNTYIENKRNDNKKACHTLISSTLMAEEESPKTIKNKIIHSFGNSKHFWNYDFESMYLELEKAGFRDIRRAEFNDSGNKDFISVEDYGRFYLCLAIECRK